MIAQACKREVKMAKHCTDCKKKIGFLSGYHKNKDGSYVCDICFDKQKKLDEIDEVINQQ